jgi:hypothetical protein
MGQDSGEPDDRKELLANTRGLTIAVLDNLEEGSRNKTLDQGEKRLLISPGARLLRLWKNALKDESVNRTAVPAGRRTTVTEEPNRPVS